MLYADTIEEVLDDGQNAIRKNYFHRLGICQAAGFAITPLSKVEIDLAGTTRVQRWHDVELEASRRDPETGDPCADANTGAPAAAVGA